MPLLQFSCHRYLRRSTVEPGDSKPVDSKLQELVNFSLLTKINNHNINHIIDSKQLAIINIFVHLKKFNKVRFDCIDISRLKYSPSMFYRVFQC